MGILDALQGISNNPAMQSGLLAAGLSMLANNQGGVSTGQALGRGGLLGMNAYAQAGEAQRQAEQDRLKAAMMQQQMQQVDAETQMKQQQLALAQQDQAGKTAFDTYLRTGQFPAAAPAQAGSVPAMLGSAAAAPATPPASALAGAMGGAGLGTNAAPLPATATAPAAAQAAAQAGAGGGILPGSPLAGMSQGKIMAIMADRQYNDGKGIANLLNPNIEITPSGVVFDKNSGQAVGSVPVVDMPTGRGSQITMQNGQYQVSPVAGGDALAAARKQTDADIAEQHNWTTATDASGQQYRVTEGEMRANPALRLQSRSPEVVEALSLGNKDFMTRNFAPAMDAGDAATNDLAQIQAMRNLNPATGWGAQALGQAAAVLGAIGVPDAAKFAGTQQEFNNVALSKLQQNLALQKGPQTEGDAKRAAQTFASLGNTPQANKFILDYAQAQAIQKQRRADFYRDALPLAQQSGDLSEIDRRWRKIQGSIWDLPQMQAYQPQQQQGR